MPRISKIVYNPNLTIAENLEENKKKGIVTSEAAIRYYIKVNKIDRREERKIKIIEDCRKAYFAKKNYKPSINELHRTVKTGKKDKDGKDTHYSVSTIRKYWKFITKEESINFDRETGKKITTFQSSSTGKNTKKYPLMSELLSTCNNILSEVEKEDVSALREWLFKNPTMPLLCIGNGGKFSPYPSLLYGINQGIGKTITPLEFASLSNAAIKSSKILLLTGGGHNRDIVYAAKRAVRLNRDNTACITFTDDSKNEVIQTVKKENCFVYKHNTGEGFISILGKFLLYGLAYKAFSNDTDFVQKLNLHLTPEECFTYQINREGKLPSLANIHHFEILYGSYGEPVAKEMESTIIESGLASVVATDYRNYCHGMFMHTSTYTEVALSGKESNICMVLLITPREKKIAGDLKRNVFPDSTPVVIIETNLNGALSSIDLLYKGLSFISVLGEKYKGTNPNNPINHAGIPKNYPKPLVDFESDWKKHGRLTFGEIDNDERRKNVEEEIAIIREKEEATTLELETNPPVIQYPTVEDLYKEAPEEYDATRVLTYAFRRKLDLRKGKSIPLGNMNQGYSFKVFGIPFHTSESAYICGMFSDDTEQHKNIQQQLIDETNGYSAKKEIRQKNEVFKREDWESYNVEWMVYVVWQKVKQNKKFQRLLMTIPDNAIIIEDTTYQKGKTSSFWGAKNEERSKFCKLVGEKYALQNLDVSDEEEEAIRDVEVNWVCNIGTYIGHNTMGKILMICKKCLQEGTEPDIDYQLLKSKHIHLLGEEIDFDKRIRSPRKKSSTKKELKKGNYTIVELHDFAEANSYAQDYGICYCKNEKKFNYYTDNGMGKLFLCLKDGYKELKKPVIHRGEKFDKHDEYSSSVIGVSISFDGRIKAINSRYPWTNGGTDSDYTKEEVESLLGKPFDETFGVSDNLPKILIGTIAGDMIGKPYEGKTKSIKTTDFPLFEGRCIYTDDTVLTIAIMDWLMMDGNHTWDVLADRFVHYGTRYRSKGHDCCFSHAFKKWLYDENREFGRVSSTNGAAMRVSPIGWYFNTIEEVEEVAKIQASLTHNHPDAIQGAQVAAVSVLLARQGKSKEDIQSFIEQRYGWNLHVDLDEYRKDYEWTMDCKETVRSALISFLNSSDYESAIRNAVSLGGDADTIGAITGGIAEAFYGDVPEHIRNKVFGKNIPNEFKDVLTRFGSTIKEQ